MRFWTIVPFAWLCLAGAVKAAEPHIWMSAGAGGAELSDRGMAGGRLGVHFSSGKSVWTVSLAAYEEADLFNTISPHESTVEGGVLYGGRWGGKAGYFSLSAGLSVLSGTHRGKLLSRTGWFFPSESYEAQHFTTVGIPVNAELALTPLAGFGLAIGGFLNLNPKYSYRGATLSLLIGGIR